MKTIFTKIYHQQGAQLNQSDQNIEFIFGKNINYHEIGIGYLEFDIRVQINHGTICHYDDPIRLIKNGFAFCFKEARLSTTFGSDFGHNWFCGQVSTIMRLTTNEDGDLSSQFDEITENYIAVLQRLADIPLQIKSTPHQKMFINNHTDPNKGKTQGFL